MGTFTLISPNNKRKKLSHQRGSLQVLKSFTHFLPGRMLTDDQGTDNDPITTYSRTRRETRWDLVMPHF